MGKKYHITDLCILDEFNLPLCEESSTDFYTITEIKQEVEKRIIKLNTLNSRYTISSENIVEYLLTDETAQVAGIEIIGTNKYKFRISKLAARKRNEKYLDTIIYHELCHVLQIEFLLNIDAFYFENGEFIYEQEQKALVDTFYLANDYHTALWYSFVKIVNTAFSINPPVDKYLTGKDISDIFLEDTFKRGQVLRASTKIIDDFSYLFKDEDIGD